MRGRRVGVSGWVRDSFAPAPRRVASRSGRRAAAAAATRRFQTPVSEERYFRAAAAAARRNAAMLAWAPLTAGDGGCARSQQEEGCCCSGVVVVADARSPEAAGSCAASDGAGLHTHTDNHTPLCVSSLLARGGGNPRPRSREHRQKLAAERERKRGRAGLDFSAVRTDAALLLRALLQATKRSHTEPGQVAVRA